MNKSSIPSLLRADVRVTLAPQPAANASNSSIDTFLSSLSALVAAMHTLTLSPSTLLSSSSHSLSPSKLVASEMSQHRIAALAPL
eukprot:CAMPEP_0172005226 /NCGR_PEP_ID=MMETSP1041-20130122/4925_1 /TAXON_ID=464988 /ORGANISM="Hemiselmis andersenii, Strain CCMP439" /LENGTH=84 /DNA_ID=CAMNT_0012659189 /DNA_START=330 /DNA_END=584 /DNA_ORIENTATION=+